MILAPLQKLPKNVGDLDKLIVAKGFKKLPKVQKSSTLVTLLMALFLSFSTSMAMACLSLFLISGHGMMRLNASLDILFATFDSIFEKN